MQLEDLKSGGDPKRTAWIAARYDSDIPNEFRLGDSSKPGTGQYHNRPLLEKQSYRVFVRAYTSNSVSSEEQYGFRISFGLSVTMSSSM